MRETNPRVRQVVAATIAMLLLTACPSPTQDRNFGVSRSVDGGLTLWFRNCYNTPRAVSLWLNRDHEDVHLWAIVAQTTSPPFPQSVVAGQSLPGYKTVTPFRGRLPEDGPLEVEFAGGEAWGERFRFELSELQTNGVLTFDRRVMAFSRFTNQSCNNQ